jgi:hypothetical protein
MNINELEKERIKLLYESKGILLNEDGIVGLLARVARRLVGKNSDDIATAFRTTEVALAKSMDDIIIGARKSKSLTELRDIEIKLMHIFNPSGLEATIKPAQENLKNFLNGYAKSKGKANWQIIRNEVVGEVKDDVARAAQTTVKDLLAGQRVSNRWYAWRPENIDFTKFSNPKETFDELNKKIASAIKYGYWDIIPRQGFEKLGITNFREYLKQNIKVVNEVDPLVGRWSVTFK